MLLVLVVLELIRKRRLRERYALLWLATGVVLLVLSVWRGGLNTIAGWFGVTGYPPAVLFAVATLFILLVLLDYSTVISKLADQNTILAQRLALLEQRLDKQPKPRGGWRVNVGSEAGGWSIGLNTVSGSGRLVKQALDAAGARRGSELDRVPRLEPRSGAPNLPAAV